MGWRSICLLSIIVLIEPTNEENIRSFQISIMKSAQFQCANTTCLPFVTLTVLDIWACQIACLNDVRCQAASFHQSNFICQLFDNINDQTGNMLTQIDTISMSVISDTRIPDEPITTTTTATTATTTATTATTTATTATTTTTTTTKTSTVTTTSTTTRLNNPCSTGIYWNVNGGIVAGTGTAGTGLNELNSPYGIYLDSNDSLYIVDSYNYRAMKYLYGASSGTVVAGATNSYGTGLNRLSSWPTALYVDSSANLYIADTYNARVMRWASGASSGSMVAGSGSSGTALNQFLSPEGVWVDSSSNVFVSDVNNHCITKWASGASSGVVVAGIAGSSGYTTNKLYSPQGFFYDEINQDLYIANLDASTIVRWHIGNSSGTVVAGVSGSSDSSANLLTSPCGITLDQWKNIYVADYSDGRIQLYCSGSSTGITIAGSGTGGSTLSYPADVRLDSEMNLYVSEYDGHRVKKFNKL